MRGRLAILRGPLTVRTRPGGGVGRITAGPGRD